MRLFKPKKREITLYHFWTGPELSPVNALIKKFQKKHPDIVVNPQEMRWESQMVQIANKKFGYAPPDVFTQEIGQIMLEFANSGRLVDVTDVWEKEGFYRAFPDWIVEKCALGDVMYAVPSKIYTFAVWYLVDVFKKYNVKPPRTWGEFLEVCWAFKERGMPPIVASAWENSLWFNHLLIGIAGVEFYRGLMEGRESWLDPRVIKAYELLKEITSFFLPHPFAYDFPKSWEKLNRHEAAMILQGDWLDGMWRHQYGYTPGREYNFFLLPPVNPKRKQTLVVGGNAWASFRESLNKRDAKTFLAYAGTREAHETLAAEGMGILARMDVPRKTYGPILNRLRRKLFSGQIAFQISVMLPQRLIDIEERERRQIVLSPGIAREEIENAVAVIDREFHAWIKDGCFKPWYHP